MDHDLAALRALVLSDEELADICTEVLTVLDHGVLVVESMEFNDVDVTVDRDKRVVEFQGVLSINDEAVRLPEERFVELARTIAEPLSGERLAEVVALIACRIGG